MLILQKARARRSGAYLPASEAARMEWRRRWLVRVPSLATLDLLQGLASMSPPGRLTARAALYHSASWYLAVVRHDGEAIFRGGRATSQCRAATFRRMYSRGFLTIHSSLTRRWARALRLERATT